MERSDSIFLTQEPHVIPAMESVHDRTGSDAIPAAVRGDIAGSLEESDLDSGNCKVEEIIIRKDVMKTLDC